MSKSINFFWFRRDLRLKDNAGLYHALTAGKPVQCLFIFDIDILDKLEVKSDRRITFIHIQLEKLNEELKNVGASLLVKHGKPLEIWKELLTKDSVECVFTNRDYEPYARKRDQEIQKLLESKNVGFKTFKDQIIFEKSEIVKDDGTPYTVFTPYMKKWRATVNIECFHSFPSEKHLGNTIKRKFQPIVTIQEIGFEKTAADFPPATPSMSIIKEYEKQRDFPFIEGTSRMSVHLRFGTISIRHLMNSAWEVSEKWVNELIWREFYSMILWHFPHVTKSAFRKKYDSLPWIKDETNFALWCNGQTGFPIVDAGMRQLNETGFMHNRVRMITSMFLSKYLLVNWQWGEAYFAKKLLDYELSSNNGGWQWSAGTGVDAAPYFRIFSMEEQTKRFDPEHKYIKKWVKEFGTSDYPAPIIDYGMARKRCLEFFKRNLVPG